MLFRSVAQSAFRLLALLSMAAAGVAYADKPADWPMFGQNVSNTASTTQSGISTSSVGKLKPKWIYTTDGEVSARSAVVNGVAYFPDWKGKLYAVAANNGKQVWKVDLGTLMGASAGSTHARTSPAVSNGVVYVGTQEGAWLLAISAANGSLIWKTQLETVDFAALITASPAVANGVVYTGVASNQEAYAAFIPGFTCCFARGSVAAVNASTGAILWQTATTIGGYSGAGVWGSNFVVDSSRNSLFVTTGNNYSTCTTAPCTSPDNHVDSVLALDLTTGAVKWATKEVNWNQAFYNNGSDDWNVDCVFDISGPAPGPNCPTNAGPDFDFASAPNLITYKKSDGTTKTILGAGQKSGIYYAFDPDTGAELWRTQVGPGSSLGGMEWGSATDGTRIYVTIANLYGLPNGSGSGGSWAALDPATGAILWQTSEPGNAVVLGPATVADGIVYVSSLDGSPTAQTMVALNAATGVKLWGYSPGSSVNAGATIVNGIVYWGSGYEHLGIPGYTTNNKFFAFSVNGQ